MSESGKCHCWGEMSERETDGHKMFHQAAYCSAQPNQLSGINPHQQPEKFLSLFLFGTFNVEMEESRVTRLQGVNEWTL